MKNSFNLNEKGQGLIEYIILVALMAIASIAVLRILSQTVNGQLANITQALQGKEGQKINLESINQSSIRKKDLSDFMNGAASQSKK